MAVQSKVPGNQPSALAKPPGAATETPVAPKLPPSTPLAPVPKGEPQDLSSDALMSDLGSFEADLAQIPTDQLLADINASLAPSDPNEGTDIFTRFQIGLRQKPADQVRFLEERFGKGNVRKASGGELEYRKPGTKEFKRVDPKGITSLSELMKDFVDLGGIGIDAAVTGAAELAGGTIGLMSAAATGPAALTTAAPLAMGGAMMGGVAAGPLSVAARGALASGDSFTEQPLGTEGQLASVLNVAAGPVASLGRKAVEGTLEAFSGALRAVPQRVKEQLGKVKNLFDEVSAQLAPKGMPFTEEAAEKSLTAIGGFKRQLSDNLDLIRDQAAKAAGNRKFTPAGLMSKMQEVLKSEGLDPAVLLAPKPPAQTPRKFGIGQVTANVGQPLPPADPRVPRARYFGLSEGEGTRIMTELVEDFRALATKGGTIQDIRRLGQRYGSLAEFEKTTTNVTGATTKRLRGVFQGLDGALTQDEQAILKASLPPESEAFKLVDNAFREYSTNIDHIRNFQNILEDPKNALNFAKSVITPDNPDQVRALSRILADRPDLLNDVHSAWFHETFVKGAVDSNTGIVSGSFIRETMDRYRGEVLNEVMTEGQQRSLKALSALADKIPASGIVKAGNESLRNFSTMARLAYGAGFNAGTTASLIYGLTRSNARVARELAEGGLARISKEIAHDPFEATRVIKTVEFFRNAVRGSEVKRISGREYLVPIPVVKGALNSGFRDVMGPESREDLLKTAKELPGTVFRLGERATP